MNRCSERERLSERYQDLLDGLVAEPEGGALRRHIADCAECSAELAGFERVIGSLERMPLATPRPELTERVLARVLPSRRRRHRVALIGWGYAACVAAFAGLVGVVAANPPARVFVEQTSGVLSQGVVETLRFTTHFVAVALLGVAGGVDVVFSTGARFAPIGRALNAVLTTPSFAAALLTAFAACAALLWWLRPVPARRKRSGPTDVGVLGFWGLA